MYVQVALLQPCDSNVVSAWTHPPNHDPLVRGVLTRVIQITLPSVHKVQYHMIKMRIYHMPYILSSPNTKRTKIW